MGHCCGGNAVARNEPLTGPSTGFTVDNAALQARKFAETELPQLIYPEGRFSGRGVVIVGGGTKFWPCVWTCLRALRHVGCKLPVEIWHRGQRFNEYNAAFDQLCQGFGAVHVCSEDVRDLHPHARLNGWELKPYAVTWCSFEEVLLIDADNVCVIDPTFLFDCPEQQATGTCLWPDYHRTPKSSGVWKIFGHAYVNEPEIESGQVVCDKRRAWAALQLANWYCERSDFYFRHVHGDKEIFHHAWRVLQQPYAMTEKPIHSLKGTMCQHDFASRQNRRIFQHRNWNKFVLETGDNEPRPGFLLEAECLQWIAELAREWSPAAQTLASAADKAAVKAAARRWRYTRVGKDARDVVLRDDGTFASGGAGCERFWTIRDGRLLISHSDGRLTMDMEPDGDGGWRGAWLIYEKMSVTLTPI